MFENKSLGLLSGFRIKEGSFLGKVLRRKSVAFLIVNIFMDGHGVALEFSLKPKRHV